MDLIDRQAAIDALKTDMAALDHIIKGISAYDVRLDAYVSQRNQVNYDIYTINNLPPAQPEPCEDAVSRKDCLQALSHLMDVEGFRSGWAVSRANVECMLKAMPSVMPKQRTGHWIPVGMVEAVGGESAQWGSTIAYHKCSECDEQALRDDFEQEILSKFCPHCGAKMEGVSE